MYIYSEKTKKRYDTVEECVEAEQEYEKAVKEEEERKAKLADERKVRAEEVKNAFKTAYDLLDAFTKDYGSFHFTIGNDTPFSFLKDWFW